MTRDELIEVLARAICRFRISFSTPEALQQGFVDAGWQHYVEEAGRVLCSLSTAGLAVVPREATDEMVKTGARMTEYPIGTWAAMVAAGDLIKGGEG